MSLAFVVYKLPSFLYLKGQGIKLLFDAEWMGLEIPEKSFKKCDSNYSKYTYLLL